MKFLAQSHYPSLHESREPNPELFSSVPSPQSSCSY